MKAIVVLVGIVVIGGGWWLVRSSSQEALPSEQDSISMEKKEDKTMMENNTSTSEDAAMKKKDDESMMQSSGRYVEYAGSVLDESKKTRRVLFFYANWCPTCRPADVEFRSRASELPNDVTVIRVNYNDPQTDAEEKALASKYGVTYQHTYVQIDESGNVVARWNGGGLVELKKNIR